MANDLHKSASGNLKYQAGSLLSKLPDLGISRDQSSRWQRIAEMPAEKFDNILAKPSVMPSTDARDSVASCDRFIKVARCGSIERSRAAIAATLADLNIAKRPKH